MSRLKIATPNKAQLTVERLYKDLERRIIASPPGLCPVDLQLSFLKMCHAQTCGKCVPCRVGLGQLQNLMADVLAVRNKSRMENWSALIRECNASGLSNREFCQQRGISEKSYYYWLRKLRNQAADTVGAKLIKLEPTAIEEDILEIRYHGAQLRLPSEVDMDAVAGLLRSIQSL